MNCVICHHGTAEAIGALCPRCAAVIARRPQRAPGVIASSQAPKDAAAWLIDAWGQAHPIGERCRVGREREHNELVIADLAISGEHAELRSERGRWRLRDRGSANGSGVGDAPRVREAPLAHRDVVWFGSLAFFFWAQADFPLAQVPSVQVKTLVPEQAAYRLSQPGRGVLVVRAAAGHALERAPGELEYAAGAQAPSRRAVLARLQFQLLRRLCERALDGGQGSVGTHELLAALPFNTARPEPNHVRQVVSSLRATLARAGVPGAESADDEGLIRSAEGVGYRVAWGVERLGVG